jgi:hypothetical protein
MQRHSYPLVILSVAEEPRPFTPAIEKKSHTAGYDVESTERARSPAYDIDESQATARPWEAQRKAEDDLKSIPGVTIRELKAEPERAEGQEGMRLGAEDMDSLPEIDTSELEAELDADIEDTLEKGRASFTASNDIGDEAAAEPLADVIPDGLEEEDDISGMLIEQDRILELGMADEEDDAAPIVDQRMAPEPLELGADEPEETPEALEPEYLYVPEGEDEAETPDASEVFHDFFTAYLTPIGSGGTAEPAGLDADVPPEVKRALGALTERIQRLEGALPSALGLPVPARVTAPARMAVVLGALTQEGFKAVMEVAPMSGEEFAVEIDRPWNPPLFLKAVAVAESSFSVNGVTLARFRFDGLDDAGRMAVLAYLDGRAGYFKSLTDIVKD